MIFDMSFSFVFAGSNFTFRWEVIPYINTLVKMEFFEISNLKKVDL